MCQTDKCVVAQGLKVLLIITLITIDHSRMIQAFRFIEIPKYDGSQRMTATNLSLLLLCISWPRLIYRLQKNKYVIRRIPVVTSILIFVHNTYLFVFRWYFPMTTISIEVIDISRQISLVNRSRDHYLQYFITNTTNMSITENLQI